MPSESGARAGFFDDPSLDETLEEDNAEFWSALVSQATSDQPNASVQSVLDIGCHRGGLLEQAARIWQPRELFGIEPIPAARHEAARRLRRVGARVTILDVSDWASVPEAGVDLALCHEVLYLIENLRELFEHVASRLTARGRAYFVVGCHSENPVWAVWKPRIEAMGYRAYDHAPLDILTIAASCGLEGSVRPLRVEGWVRYDPSNAEFPFPTIGALLDHHFRHKLLFRFTRR